MNTEKKKWIREKVKGIYHDANVQLCYQQPTLAKVEALMKRLDILCQMSHDVDSRTRSALHEALKEMGKIKDELEDC